ncbi:MAG: tetratricopeptide repeat protein [Planctomycetes bacterium]|nr:tetratricopeptide repeat protein [Planctomycetota bacterium]
MLRPSAHRDQVRANSPRRATRHATCTPGKLSWAGGAVFVALTLHLTGCGDERRVSTAPAPVKIDSEFGPDSNHSIAELLRLDPAQANDDGSLTAPSKFGPARPVADKHQSQPGAAPSTTAMAAGPGAGGALVEGSLGGEPIAAVLNSNDPFQSAVPKSLAESSNISLRAERWAYLRSSERPEDTLLRIAYQQVNAGKMDDAILSAEKLRNADPQNARAYELLAAIYNSQGKWEKAVPYFDLAIKFDPHNAGLYLQRGTIYTRQKFNGKAIDDLSQAIKLDPKSLAAYLWRALAQLNNQRYAQSAADATTVLLQNDKVADAYFLRCIARLNMGRLEPAREDYWAAVKCGLDANARSNVQRIFEPEAGK